MSHKGSPYTKVRVKCLCPVGGERRVSSLFGFLKTLFKIRAEKKKKSCRKWQRQKTEEARKRVDSEAGPLMNRKTGIEQNRG